MRKIIFVISAMFLAGQAQAVDQFMPDTVNVPVSKVYIPQGFDSNDPLQVVIEGNLPNTCYRLGPTEYKFDKGQLVIEQHAYLYKGMCLQVVIPFNKTVDFKMMLPKGNYNVVDGHTNTIHGSLPVAQAQLKSNGPDDNFYAIVEDAHLGLSNNKRAVILRGQLPGTCWQMMENKVIVESDDVVTILPIIEYFGSKGDCAKVVSPFMVAVELPADLKGRKLIQVRSLNGQSVNKIFDL